MNFSLSEEQELITRTVREFCECEMYPHEDEIERRGEVPRELGYEIARKVREIGFFAPNFPEDLGGGGLNHLDFTLLERELGRPTMALSVFWGRPSGILMACEGEQIERYLLPAVRGERMDALAQAWIHERTEVCHGAEAGAQSPARWSARRRCQRTSREPGDGLALGRAWCGS